MEKIKNFFKKLFAKNKAMQIEEKSKVNKEENNIRNTMRIGAERLELFNLQEKFEKNEVDLYSLSNEKLKKLVKLYEEQIRELNSKLGKRKNSET